MDARSAPRTPACCVGLLARAARVGGSALKNGADVLSPPLVHHQFYAQITAWSIPRKCLLGSAQTPHQESFKDGCDVKK